MKNIYVYLYYQIQIGMHKSYLFVCFFSELYEEKKTYLNVK